MRREIIRTAETLMILLILAVGFYPAVSNAWNQMVASRMITHYQNQIQSDGGNGASRVLKGRYGDSVLVDEEGLMGYLEIPSISVLLPIYEGTSDAVLEKGVGHFEDSSLPIGGESTHTVLTGHRGLPSAKLFTDLDKMGEGDTFMIHTSGKNLTYKVTDIRTVLPYETESLAVVEGEDLATLVTCTPYGVNTHRLLVTGKRQTEEGDAEYEDWNPGSFLIAQDSERNRRKGLVKPFLILMAAVLIVIGGGIRIIWIWTVDWPREKRRLRRLARRETGRQLC